MAVNLLTAQQSDWEGSDVSTGLATFNINLSQDTTTAAHGVASLKCVTHGTNTFEFVEIEMPTSLFAPSTVYNFSAFMKASAGTPTVRFYCQALSPNGAIGTAGSITLSTTFTQFNFNITTPATLNQQWLTMRVDTGNATQAITFWIDEAQVTSGSGVQTWQLGNSVWGASTVAGGGHIAAQSQALGAATLSGQGRMLPSAFIASLIHPSASSALVAAPSGSSALIAAPVGQGVIE